MKKRITAPTPLHDGSAQHGPRLLRYFAITAALAIAGILLVTGPGLRAILKSYVIREAERDAVDISAALRDLEAKALVRVGDDGRQGLALDRAQLPDLDRRLRVFLAPFGIIKIKIFDRDTRIIYSTDPTIIGKLDPDNPELAAALSGVPVSKFETKDRVWDLAAEQRPDASLVETYVPVAGEDGRIIGSFEIYKDVTDYLKAADRTLLFSVGLLLLILLAAFGILSTLMHCASRTIRARTVALQASEAKVSTILDTAGDGIITIDERGTIESFNASAEEIFGYAAHEAIGKDLGILMPSPHRESHREYLARYLRTGEAMVMGSVVEVVARRRNGTTVPIELAVSEVRLGNRRAFTGIIRDITERKQAEAEREQLHQNLLEAARELELQKAQLVEEVVHRVEAEVHARHDSLHDTLTSLPNRALLIDRLKRCIERAKQNPDYKFALLFLDFDRFKVVNDSLGHGVGDQLLVSIADRLAATLRASDTASRISDGSLSARLGGDEFVLLLDGIKDAADAARVAQRLQNTLAAPHTLNGHEVSSTASIGIVTSDLGYGSADDMLRDADAAMYQAKAAGKARHQLFDKAMHSQAVARLQLETDLRRAIDDEQFELRYQPIVKLSSARVIGFEALIRWNHPKRGLICPDDFIPLAEETGLIVPIGRWVLHEACRQLRIWQTHRDADHELSINVNVSKRQISDGQLVEEIEHVLQETGIGAQNLRLEITESVITENTDGVSEALAQLKELGIQLHMDDFGTGQSSLSHLHRFPLDVLKIDRAFMGNLKASVEYAAVVHAIITLAHNLSMTVTAEGIETPEHLAQILALDCDYAQGYLFSEPMPATEAAAVIGEQFLSRQSA